jgi:hypothetical protein
VKRETVIVYGNCQAPYVGLMLNESPLAERFDFVTVLNHAPPAQGTDPLPASVGEAVLLLEQYDERATVPVREQVRAAIPPACPVVTYPPLNLMGLWPFAAVDSRNQPEPDRPWGRYPWGDRIGLAVAKLGLPATEVFAKYMELSMAQMPDVANLLERDRALLERRDAASDVHMADYVLENVRTQHLFWTWGHTSGALNLELTRRIIDRGRDVFGPLTGTVEASLRSSAERYPGIGEEQLPVHPEVARRLDLSFCPPDTRYRWAGQSWTFEEYMTRYILLDTSW